MKIHVHVGDDGSSWYRLRYPALAIASGDVRVFRPLDSYAGAVLVEGRGRTVVDIAYPDLPDVVVVNRPYTRTSYEMIRALRRAGAAVVVDIDDDLHALDPKHPMWPITRPNWLHESEVKMRLSEVGGQVYGQTTGHPEGVWYYVPTAVSDEGCQWTRKACAEADLVTVTTPALADRYGKHGRVAVLPNCVPESYLDVVRTPNERVTIGWPGTATTHCGDLDVVGSAVAEVCDVTGAAFRAIGGAHTSRSLGVADHQAEFIDWVCLEDLTYAQAVADLDVGIVPLAASPFNAAKSWLKGIEYAALGVPFVASPRDDYVRLQALGVGLYAEAADEWRAHLRALVESDGLRAELAGRGRDAMRAWTYEERAGDWLEAWQMAETLSKTRCAA